jgi:hypothetical protein
MERHVNHADRFAQHMESTILPMMCQPLTQTEQRSFIDGCFVEPQNAGYRTHL